MHIRRMAAIFTLFCLLFCGTALAKDYSPSADTFRFTYPDEWTLDTETFLYENTDPNDSMWLANFINGRKSAFYLSVSNYTEYTGNVSFFEADEKGIGSYADTFVRLFEDNDMTCELVDIVYVPVAEIDKKVPFIILLVQEKESTEYVAFTMANGWNLEIYGYEPGKSVSTVSGQVLADLYTLIDGFAPLCAER